MRLILVLLISGFMFPQNSDTEAALYNVASNAIIGGIGALINKEPSQKRGKVFLKGMYQGALGGYLNFESKRLVRKFSETENYAYLWPSKLLNSAGSSITYNAASNRNFWERWHMDFGFSYLEFDLKREKQFRYRIMPFALYGNIDGFVNARFDLKRTFYSGHFVFKNKKLKPIKNVQPLGVALANSIQFDSSFGNNINEILAHEIIHVYQYTGYFSFNAYFKNTRAKLDKNSSFFKRYHQFFMTDFNIVPHNGITIMQNLFGVEYEDRFVEREARYYSVNNF